MAQTWNDPKRLDRLAAIWMVSWGLIWFLILKSFFWELFPQNGFGGLETAMIFAIGLVPFYVVAYRRRRILRNAGM